jgi:hypothetical protein
MVMSPILNWVQAPSKLITVFLPFGVHVPAMD